jgi:hypothetical protein
VLGALALGIPQLCLPKPPTSSSTPPPSLAPRAASRRAIANPIPAGRLTPVTRATLSVSRAAP